MIFMGFLINYQNNRVVCFPLRTFDRLPRVDFLGLTKMNISAATNGYPTDYVTEKDSRNTNRIHETYMMSGHNEGGRSHTRKEPTLFALLAKKTEFAVGFCSIIYII